MALSNKRTYIKNLSSDIPASIVVFLVALPLCLGIALASGAPLFSGIIAGIIGGIVVSIFSGSALGVSGPAAGLAVIVLSSIQELGSFELFLFAVVIAGIIQVTFGFLKAGVIAYYFPSSVIKGMLAGIGVIIILKQIPHAFGYDKDPEGDFSFFQMDGHNTLSELGYMLDHISPGALIITLISLAILILWERPFMKKSAVTKIAQGPLVAVGTGISLNIWFADLAGFSLQPDQVVNIPVAGTVSGFFSQFTTPDFSQWNHSQVYFVALTIAVVASLETLLCVEATDKLDPQRRVTPTNKELIAQGIGNTVSGLIGGLPVTQVIVRSSANIQSGGKTKAVAFFHGVLLLVCAMTIPHVINMVPLSCLAAILLVVGYKLARPSLAREMYKKGKDQFVSFTVTVLGIVFTDLLTGIGIGLAVAVFYILWNNYKTPYHLELEDEGLDQRVCIELSEHVSFLNKAGILGTLSRVPDGSNVIIDSSRTKTMHPDIAEIFDDFKVSAEARNIKLKIIGWNKKAYAKNPVKHFSYMVGFKPRRKAKQVKQAGYPRLFER